MDTIVCLVGKSGTGKTTIAFKLKHKYNIIQTFTTRPRRFKNEWGHTFVEVGNSIPFHNAIAYTFFDGYKYWATREQYRHKGISIYVIDGDGIKNLKEKVKDARIITIYLECGFFTRFIRIIKRDGFIKAIRRGYEDVIKFKYDKSNYDYVIKANENVDEVITKIRAAILHSINYKRS
jgi:guanylate kinase